jgi:hypothetical protein
VQPLEAGAEVWIVFSATKGDHQQAADFATSMVVGFIGALAFIVAGWFGFSRHWSFNLVLSVSARSCSP